MTGLRRSCLIAGLIIAAAGALYLTGERRFDAGSVSAPATFPHLERPPVPDNRLPALAVQDTRDPRTSGKPFASRDKHARLAAMLEPGAVDVPDSVLAGLAIADPDVAVREEALQQLAERGGAIAIRTLEQSLQDPHPRVRKSAIQALGRLGGTDSERVLVTALAMSSPALRLEAVDALGSLGAGAAFRHLPGMLGDADSRVRDAASDWLAEHSVPCCTATE